MMKVFVIYDSKYGNTKTVAEAILEGLKQSEQVNASIGYAKKIDPGTLASYDALIIGAPNHMGKPSITITEFVYTLSKARIDAKWFATFDTYYKRERNKGKAMRKIEKQINKHLPNLRPITSGLSVKVTGIKGPIEDGELPKAKEFGQEIANQLLAKHT